METGRARDIVIECLLGIREALGSFSSITKKKEIGVIIFKLFGVPRTLQESMQSKDFLPTKFHLHIMLNTVSHWNPQTPEFINCLSGD